MARSVGEVHSIGAPLPETCVIGGSRIGLARALIGSGVGGKPTIQFSGVNVQVVNGAGKTASVNGEGNVVIGYDENAGKHEQTGSHNLIFGEEQAFTSYGGVEAGTSNIVSSPFASVTGGFLNTASNLWASVSGGNRNTASGEDASVSGGDENNASGIFSWIGGGRSNGATAPFTSVLGEKEGTAFREYEAIF